MSFTFSVNLKSKQTVPSVHLDVTPVPLNNLRGKILRGAQPAFNSKDPAKNALIVSALKEKGITHIALFQTTEETMRYTGYDLSKFYTENGFTVVHLPIKDFSVPTMPELETTVKKILAISQNPNHCVLSHCKGGIGRTGLVLSCVVSQAKLWDGSNSIKWFRNNVLSHAVETDQQKSFVQAYYDQYVKAAPEYRAQIHINHLKAQLNSCGHTKAGRVRRNAIQVQITAHEEQLASMKNSNR